MSTSVKFDDGITRQIDFRKTMSGGWEFTWGKNTFMAWCDPAAFAGRNWVLYVEEGTDQRVIDDNLASRVEAVQSAVDWSRFH